MFGHAVLHHLPDLEACLAEFNRVLRPGGVIAFCGEPSRYGDRLMEIPKRAAFRAAPAWRALVGASAAEQNGHHTVPEEHVLETVVDVHAFTPRDLTHAARAAGLDRVRVRGEELAASLFGWTNRALEATAEPSEVPWLWHEYAYRGYLALQAVDRALLEPRLPAAVFYNLLVSARASKMSAGAAASASSARSAGRARSTSASARRARSVARGLLRHPLEHGVGHGGGPGPDPLDRVEQRAPGRGEPALGADRIEHADGLGHRGQRADPAQGAARDLAQPVGARGRAQPRGHQHQQHRARAAAERLLDPEAAGHREQERGAAEQRREHQAGGHGPAVRPRERPRQGEPRRPRRPAAAARCSRAAGRRPPPPRGSPGADRSARGAAPRAAARRSASSPVGAGQSRRPRR